jgi:hypothetical protein
VSKSAVTQQGGLAAPALDDVKAAWLWLPAITSALAYPFALRAFHATYTSDGFDLGSLLAVTAAYAVPAFGLWVAWWLGRCAPTHARTLLARRVAHLVVAVPPAFTIVGVVLHLMHIENADIPVWIGVWTVAGILAAIVMLTTDPQSPASIGGSAPARLALLRYAHGYVAVAIMVVFLAPHLVNHLFGFGGSEAHASVMTALRTVYRNAWIEPLLIVLVFFQVLSGIVLWRPRTAEGADLLATLQTASGVYLAVYLAAHVNSVFTLARYFGTDTTWDWATGAPGGLAADAWNVRLIPHYSLAVLMLLAHLACGLRVVMLAHGVPAFRADRITWSLVGVGALMAIAISAAMLGVRI